MTGSFLRAAAACTTMGKDMKTIIPDIYVAAAILVPSFFRLPYIAQRQSTVAEYISGFSNIVPLHEIVSAITTAIDTKNVYYLAPLVANFVVMVPVGLFYGYFMKRLSFKTVGFVCIRYVFLFSIIYGVRILLKMGSFDVDDILLNIIGMLCGIFLASQRKIKECR